MLDSSPPTSDLALRNRYGLTIIPRRISFSVRKQVVGNLLGQALNMALEDF